MSKILQLVERNISFLLPYLLSRLNISKNLFHLLLIDLTKINHEKSGGKHQLDLGPLFIVHVKGISNGSVLSSLNTSLHKFVIDLRLNTVHLASKAIDCVIDVKEPRPQPWSCCPHSSTAPCWRRGQSAPPQLQPPCRNPGRREYFQTLKVHMGLSPGMNINVEKWSNLTIPKIFIWRDV